MAILKVCRLGHPVLRRVAEPVPPGNIVRPAFQQFIDDMIETMHEYEGVGLAAPQVHEDVRLFVAVLDGHQEGEAEGEPVVIVNPEITPVTGTETIEGWEGCLSIPDVRGRVPRAREITLRGLDRRGERFERQLQDFPARVAQHEADHLDGILFFDRMRSFESLTFLDEYSRYWAKD